MGCVTDIPVCSGSLGSQAIYGSFSEWGRQKEKINRNNILNIFS